MNTIQNNSNLSHSLAVEQIVDNKKSNNITASFTCLIHKDGLISFSTFERAYAGEIIHVSDNTGVNASIARVLIMNLTPPVSEALVLIVEKYFIRFYDFFFSVNLHLLAEEVKGLLKMAQKNKNILN
jgi:hypothetical protein